ncbi:Crp/Fnr family transcriptional regulator [Chryseobacterium chendengshani]|uniref:Crp/Fnr family transcriptional regulator n=1 Tax=unclassified Chryseobacterium TaxID=2593645 RepID=UPI001C63D985|nr:MULTISPECIES: Crp/Fnr family transcriptional regulator [unclassified Chryseobacterium]MBW7676371.1 Crp/Fnr family transcriptional regulator [Chryseobacterium sp. LJ756]MBW8523744.1 Crp/Fnr family transcriptional regulator [Chryseobacterium sp. LJ668]QYK16688.1 Crp/Fnr family transcriptional regulator [Chryseobacterium sp. LJ668]
MLVDEDLLFRYGGELMSFDKNDIIFRESETPKFYYQIKYGNVKINNYHQEGKEFIHSFPTTGHCLGETFIFSNRPYPVNAVAMTDAEIIRVQIARFLELIKNNQNILFKLYQYTSERMHYRYVMLNSLSSTNPFNKVICVMDCLKEYHNVTEQYLYQIPYTRLEIASLTGLRVETVIRVIKRMERENIVKIVNGKIFY